MHSKILSMQDFDLQPAGCILFQLLEKLVWYKPPDNLLS